MTPQLKLEALLFSRGEPLSRNDLPKLLACSDSEAAKAVLELKVALQERGLTLVTASDDIELRTAPEAASFLEKIRKEELEKPLGKAALEVLAIILYRGEAARSEIDYIRGVNSTFTLRALLIRGLIERVENQKDRRSFLYRPTIELLSHLGIRAIEELPEYATVLNDLQAFAASKDDEHGGTDNDPA